MNGKLEAKLHSHTELAAGAELRSWTTLAKLVKGLEHPNIRMGPAKRTRIRGWGLEWEQDPWTTDLLGPGPLLALGWTE